MLLILTVSCRRINNDCNSSKYLNSPEQSWFKSYNGTEEESHGHFIMTCSDGGFLQIGETGFIPNSAKTLVVKTDNQGNLQWKKEFGSSGINLGNSAIEINDGYVICGSINENSTLIKINKSDGSLIFQKSHDNGGSDAFEHVAVAKNGFIAVGYINAQDNSNTFYTEGEGYITLLDSAGTKQSGFNVNNQISHAYRIKASGSEFMVSGLTQNAEDYALMKIDSCCNILWTKTYGGSGHDHCFGMDLSVNGYIFLTGHTNSDTQNWDTYTMKIDQTGNLLWEAKTGNPRGFDPKYIHDESWGIKSTIDGGCIIVAGTGDEYGNYKRTCGKNKDNSNIWHVYLIKYDQSGNIEWEKTYSGEGNWAGEDIDITSDGGAIIAVDNGQFGFLKIRPF